MSACAIRGKGARAIATLVEGKALLEKRAELEKKVEEDAVESSSLRAEVAMPRSAEITPLRRCGLRWQRASGDH